LEWRLIPKSEGVPRARGYHSAVVHKDSMFVFGGSQGIELFDDLFFEYKLPPIVKLTRLFESLKKEVLCDTVILCK
jgi:hypothetical protein